MQFNLLEKELGDIPILEGIENIVVTGATGIIGSNLIRLLIRYKKNNNLNYKIYGLCRSEDKLEKLVGEGVIFNNYDMLSSIDLDVISPIIIHTASPTSTKMFVDNPTEVHRLINNSTYYINEFAIKTNAIKLIQLSTMEVYGEQSDNILIKEDDNFGLDMLNPRNCYPIAKISSENFLMASFKENNLPVVILRLTQVMAPPIDINDNRVIFQFAKRIIDKENIVMKTTGQTHRSYIYYIDVLSAIIVSMQYGINGEVYNVATPGSCVSILELANRMIKVENSNIKVEFDIESDSRLGYRDNLGLCIDSNKLINIGWKPIYTLEKSLQMLMTDFKGLVK